MNKTEELKAFIEALTENLSDLDIEKADLKSDLATSIANRRVEMGLSQKELAQAIGKSQATISKWENGDTNFTVDSLVEIANDLEMEISIKLSRQSSTPKTGGYTTGYQGGACKVYKFPEKNRWTKTGYLDDLEEM